MIEVTVVNSKHLYPLLHPEQSNSRLYKQFRTNLLHETVEPHLDKKANTVPAVNPNENCLYENILQNLNIPREKLALLVGIMKILRQTIKKKDLQL